MEEVRVDNVCMVIPASPTNPHNLFLSALDLFWMQLKGTRHIFFYRTNLQDHHIELLKSSLSSMLVDFYPAAGRLRKNQDTGRAEINGNDSGVEFIEASTAINFQQLVDGNFQHREFFDKLAPYFRVLQDDQGNVDLDAPLVSLQVTRFAGGGVSIGTAFQHVLGDGKSFYQLMSSWCELARGLSYISVKPLHGRESLMLSNKGEEPEMFCYKALRVENGSDILKAARVDSVKQESFFPLELKEKKLSDYYSYLGKKKMVQWRFELGEETVRSLKTRSEARSSFVGVAAHLWKWSIMARMPELPLEGKVGFTFLVDYRSRISTKGKSLSMESYFGNCVVPVKVRSKSRDVVERDVVYSAKLIHRAIDECATEEYMWDFIKWMESMGRDGDLRDAVSTLIGANSELVGGVNVAGTQRFPVYDMDFGWGKPEGTEAASMNQMGSVLIGPTRYLPPGYHVSTALLPSHMFNLQHLLEFGVGLPVDRGSTHAQSKL